jgi:uncharacterized FlaG/YvyC family protein
MFGRGKKKVASTQAENRQRNREQLAGVRNRFREALHKLLNHLHHNLRCNMTKGLSLKLLL